MSKKKIYVREGEREKEHNKLNTVRKIALYFKVFFNNIQIYKYLGEAY